MKLARPEPEEKRAESFGDIAEQERYECATDTRPFPEPPTRELPRPEAPRPPAGWTDLGRGDWVWTAPHRSLTVALRVHDDGCSVSAPAVSGFGRFWLVATELEAACHAVQELLEYLRALRAWTARSGAA